MSWLILRVRKTTCVLAHPSKSVSFECRYYCKSKSMIVCVCVTDLLTQRVPCSLTGLHFKVCLVARCINHVHTKLPMHNVQCSWIHMLFQRYICISVVMDPVNLEEVFAFKKKMCSSNSFKQHKLQIE